MTHPSSAVLTPDTNLTIYCLKGVVPDDYPFVGPGFIGNWLEDGHSFLFFLQPEESVITAIIRDFKDIQLIDTYSMTYAQWQGGSIEPFRLGRFLFNPPWLKAAAGPDEIAMTLDPGVVFGNGSHPTTADCLQAIEIACKGGKVRSMLDLGTGTGILALAGARLGCRQVLAVDFTLLAARTAWRNVLLNDLRQRVLVINGRAEECTAVPSDLLVANIHFEVMKTIITSPGFLKQKWFVLSGLQQSEAEKIITILHEKPVLILKRFQSEGNWQTILGITEDGKD